LEAPAGPEIVARSSVLAAATARAPRGNLAVLEEELADLGVPLHKLAWRPAGGTCGLVRLASLR